MLEKRVKHEKVSVKEAVKKKQIEHRKQQRRNQLNQIRKQKRENIINEKRKLGFDKCPPLLILVLYDSKNDLTEFLNLVRTCDPDLDYDESQPSMI